MHVFLIALLAALLVYGCLLFGAAAQEIDVVNLTGVDTHHITLRARVDEGILILS